MCVKVVGRVFVIFAHVYRFGLSSESETGCGKGVHSKLHFPEQILVSSWIISDVVRVLYNFSKFTEYRSFWLSRVRYDSMICSFL